MTQDFSCYSKEKKTILEILSLEVRKRRKKRNRKQEHISIFQSGITIGFHVPWQVKQMRY